MTLWWGVKLHWGNGSIMIWSRVFEFGTSSKDNMRMDQICGQSICSGVTEHLWVGPKLNDVESWSQSYIISSIGLRSQIREATWSFHSIVVTSCVTLFNCVCVCVDRFAVLACFINVFLDPSHFPSIYPLVLSLVFLYVFECDHTMSIFTFSLPKELFFFCSIIFSKACSFVVSFSIQLVLGISQ